MFMRRTWGLLAIQTVYDPYFKRVGVTTFVFETIILNNSDSEKTVGFKPFVSTVSILFLSFPITAFAFSWLNVLFSKSGLQS